jgi:hypothetical protein
LCHKCRDTTFLKIVASSRHFCSLHVFHLGSCVMLISGASDNNTEVTQVSFSGTVGRGKQGGHKSDNKTLSQVSHPNWASWWVYYRSNIVFTELVPETLYSNELTRLCAREDYIESCRRESFKTCITDPLTRQFQTVDKPHNIEA